MVSALASINEVNLRRPRLVWDGRPCQGSIPGVGHLFRYVTNQPPKANSAFHPSGVGKRVPASAGKAKAGMVHSVSGWTRGVQVELWDTLRTHAIPERLRCVFTTRRYTNPRLLYLTKSLYSATLLCLTRPTEAFPWDDLRKILPGCHQMANVLNGVEILPKITIDWVGCTNVTDDRQTDGR